jgi:hypothetical protein
MYKISVPIMNFNVEHNGREQMLQELRRFDVERVFLAMDCYELDAGRRRAAMEALAENCRFFKANGLEVGAWIWTFWVKNNQTFRNMRTIGGKELPEAMCPTDDSFVEFAADYVAKIAACGVDMIQFDDDFRYGFLADAPACLCDAHIEAINRMTGVVSTRAELEQYIVSGAKNKFRDAYLQANGTEGSVSYGLVVDLAVAYFHKNIEN